MESNIEFFEKQRKQAVLLDDRKELARICSFLLPLTKEDFLTEYYLQYAQGNRNFTFSCKPTEEQAEEIFFHQLRKNTHPDKVWLEQWIAAYMQGSQDKFIQLLHQNEALMDKKTSSELRGQLFEFIPIPDEEKKDKKRFHAVLFIVTGLLIYGLLALSVYFFIDKEALFFTNVFFLLIPVFLIAKGILKLLLKRDPFYYVVPCALFLLIVFSYLTMFWMEPNIFLHIKRIALFLIEFWEYIARKLV